MQLDGSSDAARPSERGAAAACGGGGAGGGAGAGAAAFEAARRVGAEEVPIHFEAVDVRGQPPPAVCCATRQDTDILIAQCSCCADGGAYHC
eukprot:3271434-Prymnesium_polylepis.1